MAEMLRTTVVWGDDRLVFANIPRPNIGRDVGDMSDGLGLHDASEAWDLAEPARVRALAVAEQLSEAAFAARLGPRVSAAAHAGPARR